MTIRSQLSATDDQSSPRWSGYLTATTTAVASGTDTPIKTFTVEGTPVGVTYSTSTGYLTVATGGRYLVLFQLYFAAPGATAAGNRLGRIIDSTNKVLITNIQTPSTANATCVEGQRVLTLTAGQQILLRANHTQGTSVNLLGSTTGELTYLQVLWIGA